MPHRVSIRYDAKFSQPNTWIMNTAGDGIRVRVQVVSSPERVFDIPIRHRRSHAAEPEAVHARQLDDATWLLEGCRYQAGMARLELALVQVPEAISDALRRL